MRSESNARYVLEAGQVGTYGEWARYAFRPGLDIRLSGAAVPVGGLYGNTTARSESAKLVGPRFAYARGRAHPYVEALFGSAHQDAVKRADGSFVNVDGTMRRGAAGLDLDVDTYVQVRAFEHSVGRIHVPYAPLQHSFTTGLLFRFPGAFCPLGAGNGFPL